MKVLIASIAVLDCIPGAPVACRLVVSVHYRENVERSYRTATYFKQVINGDTNILKNICKRIDSLLPESNLHEIPCAPERPYWVKGLTLQNGGRLGQQVQERELRGEALPRICGTGVEHSTSMDKKPRMPVLFQEIPQRARGGESLNGHQYRRSVNRWAGSESGPSRPFEPVLVKP